MDFKYDWNHECRGRALIICNEFKDNEGLRRKGCKNDLRMMKELFTRLDFHVTMYKDLTADQMKAKLKRYAGMSKQDSTEEIADEGHNKGDTERTANKDAEDENNKQLDRENKESLIKDGGPENQNRNEKGGGHEAGHTEKVANKDTEDEVKKLDRENRDSDCFVCVISTHGEEIREDKQKDLPPEADVWKHAVYGEDDQRVYVEDIIKMYDDAAGLAGKPKLFFIQACRSRGSDDRLIRITYPKYDHGNYVQVETEQRGIVAYTKKLYKSLKTRHKKHSIYSEKIDIVNNIKDLYKGWLKDKDEYEIDDNSDQDSGDDSSDGYSGEEDEEDLYENYVSSEDDQEDAFKTTKDVKGIVKEDSRASRNREEDSRVSRNTEEGSRPPRDTESPPVLPLPVTPFDVVPIMCPEDFLIMYPVMPGKTALRNPTGSYLLKFLHKGDNLSRLIQGDGLLQYLTYVCHDIESYKFLPDLKLKSKLKDERPYKLRKWMDASIKHMSKNKALSKKVLCKENWSYLDKNQTVIEDKLKEDVKKRTNNEMRCVLKQILPFKMTSCLVHRLRDDIRFSPKTDTCYTPMARVKDFIEQNS